jgi:hypothetical protein
MRWQVLTEVRWDVTAGTPITQQMWENMLRQVAILKMRAADISVALLKFPENGNFKST